MFHHSKHHNLLRARALFRRGGASGTGAWMMPVIIGAFLFLAVSVLVALPFGLVAAAVYERAMGGKSDLLAAELSAEKMDFDTALTETVAAADKFRAARADLDRIRFLSFAPYAAERLAAADSLLNAGQTVAEAVRQVLLAGQGIVGTVKMNENLPGALSASLPDLATKFKDLAPQQKRDILASVADSAPQIKKAVDQVNNAILAFDGLPDDPVVQRVKAPLAPVRAKLVTLRDSLTAVLPAAMTLPAILGYPDEKHYLFFFENDTELRPTGGFLSMVGSFTVRDAELASVEVNDVYALDGPSESLARPAPPAPIKKYIGVDKWYLRDANWSPDFPTSAADMERIYDDEYLAANGRPAPSIDGIIAVTPTVAADLLRLTGPVTVDKHKFDADNLVDELEFQVEKGFAGAGIPFEQRKNIVGQLLDEVVKRVTSFSLTRLLDVVAIVDRGLTRGDILLLAKDPALQQMVLDRDWGGKLKDVSGDYVSVIDANLGSLKSDPQVERSVRYTVVPANGVFTGRVAVTYHNRGSFTWKTTRYRTYTRVYVPAGSELIGVAGAMANDKIKDPAGHPGQADAGDEAGRRWFGAFISIEPGETKTLEFSFKLASSVVRSIMGGAYALDVEKQDGTVGRGLTLDLDFGKKLTSAEPPEDPREFGDNRYRYATDLDIDRHFEARF